MPKTSDRLDEAKSEVLALEKEVRRLKRENTKVKNRLKAYKSIAGIANVDVVADMAAESPMKSHEWIVMKLTEAIESKDANLIPVESEFFKRFEKLATARGVSTDNLALSPNVTNWLNRGINNNLL